MARQGLLPSFLARLHPTRKTPHIAIFVLMLIVTALALSGGISDLASATSILLLIVFAIVNAALIVLKRRPGEPNPSFDVPSIVPLMGVLVCSTLVIVRLYDALTAPTLPNMSPPWRAPLVAGILVLSIVILYFVMRPKTVELED
jgi:amino acid transporter